MSNVIAGLMKTGSSPINLEEKNMRCKKFAPLIMSGHWLNDGEAILSNNGHTAIVHLSGNRMASTVTGGPLLRDQYELSNATFHWGKDNCNGSEHQINGTWFTMEAQMVHWNRKYRQLDECFKHKDGICILAYFFLVTDECSDYVNPLFGKITENLKYIVNPDTVTTIPANSLCWMRDATRCPKYYMYTGSYNAGSDLVCATWIIFPLSIPIGIHQIQEFRKLRNRQGNPIVKNCQEIRATNGRRIFIVASNS